MRLTTKLILGSLLAIPASSLADPSVNMAFTGAGLGNDYSLTFNGSTETVFVGALNFSVNSSPNPTTTYCVDLDHFITGGQTWQSTITQTNSLPSGNVDKLAGDILNANLPSATDNDHAAALQIAIWTAVYGNQFSLSGVSSTVQSLATADYTKGLSTNANATLYKSLSGSGGQDQIGTTPEPASMLALGVGAIGLFARPRRKKTTAAL